MVVAPSTEASLTAFALLVASAFLDLLHDTRERIDCALRHLVAP